MKNKLFLVLIALLVVAGITVGAPRPAFTANSDLIISEIGSWPACTNSASSCTNQIQTNYEWVEIYNKGTAPVNVNGWQICDSNLACDTIAASDTFIGAGEYWVIANSNSPTDYLSQEFALYPGTPAVNNTRTLYINSPIGNGIGEASDTLFLRTNEATCGAGSAICVSDCVSWSGQLTQTCNGDGGTTTSGLIDGTTRAYLTGSDGVFTDAPFAPAPGMVLGQSIANIAGIWYQHGPDANIPNQASPYVSNTAEDGDVTAVSLSDFSANSATNLLIAAGVLLLAGGLGLLVLRRQRS